MTKGRPRKIIFRPASKLRPRPHQSVKIRWLSGKVSRTGFTLPYICPPPLRGSAGFALVASDGVGRFTIPNGTVIRARGYFLGTNSVAYSPASRPAGHATTVTGDATYTTEAARSR